LTMMEPSVHPRRSYTVVIVVLVLALGLVIGGGMGYVAFTGQVTQLQQQVQSLQAQVQSAGTSTTGSSTTTSVIISGNVSISQLYSQVKDSIVVITGMVNQGTFFGSTSSEIQGSGFVYKLNGTMVVVTNFHVVDSASGIAVTFSNGDSYAATVLGTDPYSDLAVLSVQAPSSEFVPLTMVSSSSLSVGDPVMAVGAPFGLTGSLTTGVVSALGRTISESTVPFAIADAIQTSAPINPGNSGGPLLNFADQVVGITTATATDSQGNSADAIGFAVPSATILREINSLVANGTYTQHSYLGITDVDMDLAIAQAMNINTTYGVLIQSVVSGGPASSAGLKAGTQHATVEGNALTLGGDVITAINGHRILNSDALSAYLEGSTLPGQSVTMTMIRNGQATTVSVTLGTRPAPGS
jgi:S1-C subfamily serine protease